MILSTIVFVGLLAATTANGSAIKGRDEYATKGGARQFVAPVEYQRQYYEQREAYAKGQEVKREEAPAAPEQTKLTDSDLYQQREEAKGDKQQFYEAQPQLREERLVQLPEQTRYEDYQQQREEAPAVVKQAVKSVVKQEESQVKVQQRDETKQVAYERQQFYEAKPQVQVREEVVVAAAPVKGPAKVEQVYSKADEQVQYVAQAPTEQTKLEEVQRVEEFKGEKKEAQRDELKSASAKSTVQRVEEVKFEQERVQQAPQQQQVVELTKQDYEQRRLEEQTEQRSEEQFSQVREELVKGGLRAAGAEAEPYAFDYSVEGSSRRESGDQHGVVRGQYTIQNPDGSQRIVDYVADRDGFRAQVQTNEFGTESQQPANVAVRSSQPTAESLSLRLDGKTREQAPAQQPQQSVAVKSAQPVVQVVEVANTKTAYVENRASSAPVKGPEPQLELRTPLVVAHEPAAYKGQRAEEAPVVKSYQQRPVEPIKSAELRAPKSPAGQLKSSAIVARASGFETATAHRPVVHAYPAPVVRHVQPHAPVVRHQLVTPVRSHHHHQHLHHVQPVPVGSVGVSRSQLQHDRYPPASYRREQLVNPRVSFYANNFEDEQPAGFEHPAADLV